MKHTVDKKTIKGGKYDKVPENYNGTVYICPMHPEVRDVEKSDCPICGMFLQPEDEIDGASHVSITTVTIIKVIKIITMKTIITMNTTRRIVTGVTKAALKSSRSKAVNTTKCPKITMARFILVRCILRSETLEIVAVRFAVWHSSQKRSP